MRGMRFTVLPSRRGSSMPTIQGEPSRRGPVTTRSPPKASVIATLTAVGPVTWASILSKTLLYLSSMIAAGAVIFLLLFNTSVGTQVRAVHRPALGAALSAAPFSLLLIDLRACFLGGGTPDAAMKTTLFELMMEGRLGTSTSVRLTGLALILMLVVDRPAIRSLGWALLIAASFAFIGHSLGEPRPTLATLLTLHIQAAAFWIGGSGHSIASHGRGPPSRRVRSWSGSAALLSGSSALWCWPEYHGRHCWSVASGRTDGQTDQFPVLETQRCLRAEFQRLGLLPQARHALLRQAQKRLWHSSHGLLYAGKHLLNDSQVGLGEVLSEPFHSVQSSPLFRPCFLLFHLLSSHRWSEYHQI